MFDNTLIQQLAHELNQSEKSRVQIEHFSKRYPGMTIEDGYRINRAWMAIKFAMGPPMLPRPMNAIFMVCVSLVSLWW
eukprot:gene23764-30022_t